jgi:toxin-antitoxin system PIN domain toxin
LILTDVNLLVYAHREDFDQHLECRQWLEETLASGEPFGMANIVLSGFIRIVTHRKIFSPPSTMTQAMAFASAIHDRSNCVAVNPGQRHWNLFKELCTLPDVKAGLVADAYLAALAVEHGCEFATLDGDFARFSPPLRLHRPF